MVTPQTIRENNQGFTDAFSRRDAVAVAAFYTEDATLSMPGLPEPAKGRAAIETQYAQLFNGFRQGAGDYSGRRGVPDISMKFITEVVEGDTGAVEWLMAGTQTGTLVGGPEPLPPTGKQVIIRGAAVFKVNSGGKLTEDAIYFDQLSMMAQLGLLPEPG